MPKTYRNWDDADLMDAVAFSKSIAGVIRWLGLIPAGGNYMNIKRHITRLGLSTTHFTGQASNKGVEFKPIVLSGQSKKRLLKELGHRCQECGLSTWNDLPIPLEIEHMDGNRQNNNPFNLRLLCCNCHAQTPTWRRKKAI